MGREHDALHPAPPADAIRALARALEAAERVLFVTGAGVSADSGLPTYRGVGGLYNGVVTADGMPIEDALSGEMLRARPELCWKYLLDIERACRGATPNRAHEVMAAVQARRGQAWILTQNVDGLHRDAGASNIIEIHGNLRELCCLSCTWTAHVRDFSRFELGAEASLGEGVAPRCPRCNAHIRPRVVLFGEMLPTHALRTLERELQRGFSLVVSVGTTSTFPYIAGPVLQAKQQGTQTVEVNPGQTILSDIVDLKIESGAAATFEALAAEVGL